jgi:transcriptional regulator with XRE-family HTH domain
MTQQIKLRDAKIFCVARNAGLVQSTRMNLKTYLDTEGITASEFATRIGVAVSTITRSARGEAIPSVETMRLIIDATNGRVTPNDFYEGAA